jgi:hypothetical protein
MKTLIFIALIIFTISYWGEVTNFVAGYSNVAAKWLVEHTPKK